MRPLTAGCRLVETVDDASASFPTLVLYPSTSPERSDTLGPYPVDVARNAPVADGRHPLVVISHGGGGSHLVYRTLAAHLARHGFVVATPEHPGNNRNDNSLAGTAANLANRPRQLSAVIDHLSSSEQLGPHVVPDSVAVVGHSMGGYTALAVAGGRPGASAHETTTHRPEPVPVTADKRIAALVLLAPATAWFTFPGALADVRVPILMLTGDKDEITPPWHAEVVKKGLPPDTPIEHRIVAGAGHFSFLSPFPASMISPDFPPSQDPHGFDRVAFHERLNSDVLAFLSALK